MRLLLFSIPLLLIFSSLTETGAAMYSYVDQNGRMHFTNVPADPRYRKVPGYKAVRNAAEQGRYWKYINNAAKRFSLDPELIRAIIKVESGFNPFAVSHKGAQGLMQLMPQTAKEMRVDFPFEAEDNIMGGSRYLRKMLNLFEGDLKLGLAAYNAGPARVRKKRSVPNIPETEQYVKKVMREYDRNRIKAMALQGAGVP